MRNPRFVPRSWERSEEDDFKLNVQTRLNERTEAQPVTSDCKNTEVVGWVIVSKYS